MDFKVFDTRKIDEYSKRAKEQWGQTYEYKEFEEKTKNWTKDDEATAANEFMQLFVKFGQMKEMNPADEQVQFHSVPVLSSSPHPERYRSCADCSMV